MKRESRLFEDQTFGIPADRIECHVAGNFQLLQPVEEARKLMWEALRAKRPTAFDGALLRMASHQREGERLIVSANRTSFSAYVATRHPAFSVEHPRAERADPLGLTAVVLTLSQKEVLQPIRTPVGSTSSGVTQSRVTATVQLTSSKRPLAK